LASRPFPFLPFTPSLEEGPLKSSIFFTLLDLIKPHCCRFSLSTSVSPANFHFTNCSTFIVHPIKTTASILTLSNTRHQQSGGLEILNNGDYEEYNLLDRSAVQFSISIMFLQNIKELVPHYMALQPSMSESSFSTPVSFLPCTSYWGANSHFLILPPVWLFLKIKTDRKQRNTTSSAKNSSILHTQGSAK
jgi:hypothetical protein